MQRGVRRYQNEDGTWTELGKERRRKGTGEKAKKVKKAVKKTVEAVKPYVMPALVAAGAAIVSTTLAGLMAGSLYSTTALGFSVVSRETVHYLLGRAGLASVNTVTRKVFNNALLNKKLKHSERFSYECLYHSGRKGMHWGERNYQNPDGTWTELGKARRRKGGNASYGYNTIDYKKYKNDSSLSEEEFDNAMAHEIERARKYTSEEYSIMDSRTGYTTLSDELESMRQRAVLDTKADYEDEIRGIIKKQEQRKRRELTEDEKNGIIDRKLEELNDEVSYINDMYDGIKTKPQVSMYEDMMHINPDGYSENCPSCTMAYILRRQGIDAKANGMNRATIDDIVKSYATNGNQAFASFNLKNEYSNVNSGSVQNRGFTDILLGNLKERYVRGAENVPHFGACMVQYNAGSGHIFPWEYDPRSGKIVLVDPQSNNNPSGLIEMIGTGMVYPEVRTLGNLDIDIERLVAGTNGSQSPVVEIGNSSRVNSDFLRRH